MCLNLPPHGPQAHFDGVQEVPRSLSSIRPAPFDLARATKQRALPSPHPISLARTIPIAFEAFHEGTSSERDTIDSLFRNGLSSGLDFGKSARERYLRSSSENSSFVRDSVRGRNSIAQPGRTVWWRASVNSKDLLMTRS